MSERVKLYPVFDPVTMTWDDSGPFRIPEYKRAEATDMEIEIDDVTGDASDFAKSIHGRFLAGEVLHIGCGGEWFGPFMITHVQVQYDSGAFVKMRIRLR